MSTPALCRDCCDLVPAPTGGRLRCPRCFSPRLVAHPELTTLSIAHVDCDAFYASVEKRDNPALREMPVIVGGGQRGVVTTACYIARIRGVRSAMPMFQARRLCPEAVVVPPRMDEYARASRQIRAIFESLTPLVEPLSLDEAFLDLTGTHRLHGAPPAVMLARLAARIASEVGVTVSVGLSHNKFLAKIASDLDKPRGLALIGQAETADFLRARPVGLIWGVGPGLRQTLERDGLRRIGDILPLDQATLIRRYGSLGLRLWHLARGQDDRSVAPDRPVKSLSNETTFAQDLSDPATLDGHLWRLAVKVSDRAKALGLAGRVVTLKLKQADFRQITRRTSLRGATRSADTIYEQAAHLMLPELPRAPFRLLGCGLAGLEAADSAQTGPDLFDQDGARRKKAEAATDLIREKFGPDSIIRGRALR